MSRRSCEFCEREIPIGSAVCPHCAKPQTPPSAWPRQALLAILAFALAAGVLVAWGFAMR
jgi:hypothetical protein